MFTNTKMTKNGHHIFHCNLWVQEKEAITYTVGNNLDCTPLLSSQSGDPPFPPLKYPYGRRDSHIFVPEAYKIQGSKVSLTNTTFKHNKEITFSQPFSRQTMLHFEHLFNSKVIQTDEKYQSWCKNGSL